MDMEFSSQAEEGKKNAKWHQGQNSSVVTFIHVW